MHRRPTAARRPGTGSRRRAYRSSLRERPSSANLKLRIKTANQPSTWILQGVSHHGSASQRRTWVGQSKSEPTSVMPKLPERLVRFQLGRRLRRSLPRTRCPASRGGWRACVSAREGIDRRAAASSGARFCRSPRRLVARFRTSGQRDTSTFDSRHAGPPACRRPSRCTELLCRHRNMRHETRDVDQRLATGRVPDCHR